MLTTLQYRVLRRIAPSEPARASSAYADRSKLTALLGPTILDRCRGGDVLDFGCGDGLEAVELAGVARSVFGLDIVPRLIDRARALAAAQHVEQNCTFGTEAPSAAFDVIISLDAFEHFADPAGVLSVMHGLLRPTGHVYASFGPTWYHPFGGHLFSVFPWAHLMFSETALIRWRADIRSDGATRFSEVEGGLNRMTIARFERIARASPLAVTHLETVPIHHLERLHGRATREFTTSVVRCELAPRSGAGADKPASRHLRSRSDGSHQGSRRRREPRSDHR